MKRAFALELISFLYVLLFVYAAISKLFEYEKFAIQIGQSPILSGFREVIPWAVITLELSLSLLLMFQKFRLIGFFSALSLMTMFTAYIVIILNYSAFVPCSCGGVLERLGWTEHLLFNAFFILLALIGIFLHRSSDNKLQEMNQPDTLFS